ncbi:hypothetical protein HK102_003215 [Quaeritorhiza haematococci]|nr:hypothetical protein HK102_003215 [Quaeritorhiza haematococci]
MILQELECMVELDGGEGLSVFFELPVRVNAPPLHLLKIKNRKKLEASTPQDECIEARLKVIFRISHAGKVVGIDSMVLLPDYLVVHNAFEAPQFPLEISLFEFVAAVEDNLKAAADKIQRRESMRQIFILSFVSEYNIDHYTYASFYFECPPKPKTSLLGSTSPPSPGEKRNVGAIVNVHLSPLYPEAEPKVVILSPNHFKSETSHIPESAELKFKYSPDWDPQDVITKIIIALQDQIPSLHQSATRAGKLE